MNKLLTQNRLKKRASVLVRLWGSHGVSVSPVAHDRYWLLVDRLRGGRSWPLQWTKDLLGEIRNFTIGSDMLAILGWNVDEEPALLVGADKLVSKLSSLDQIYPDGFILIDEVTKRALLVDFNDEDGSHISMLDLSDPSLE